MAQTLQRVIGPVIVIAFMVMIVQFLRATAPERNGRSKAVAHWGLC